MVRKLGVRRENSWIADYFENIKVAGESKEPGRFEISGRLFLSALLLEPIPMHTSYLPHVAIALVMLGRSTHKGIGFFTTALGLMIQTKVKMSIETLADAQPTNCSALVSCLEDVFFITGSFKQLINLHHGNA